MPACVHHPPAHPSVTHLVCALPLLPPAGKGRRLLERRRQRRRRSVRLCPRGCTLPTAATTVPLAPQGLQCEEDEEAAAEQAAEGELGLVKGRGAVRPGAENPFSQHDQPHHKGHRPLLPPLFLLSRVGGRRRGRRRRLHGGGLMERPAARRSLKVVGRLRRLLRRLSLRASRKDRKPVRDRQSMRMD